MTGIRLRLALFALVVFSFSSVVVAKMELCVQDEAMFYGSEAQREAALQRARELGASYIRRVVYTFDLDPCNPSVASNQNSYDDVVTRGHAYGLKTQMVFTGVADPSWGVACKGKAPSGRNPSVPGWQAFLEKWMPHYYKLGVRRFSLWNEPNNPTFLSTGKKDTGASLGHLWRKLVNAGLSTIKKLQKKGAVGHDIQIFLGEMAGLELSFLNAALSGPKLVADAFSYHPYQFCQNPKTDRLIGKAAPKCNAHMSGISTFPQAQTFLKQMHSQHKFTTSRGGLVPLYLTEFGYQRMTHADGSAASSLGIPEAYRAKWWPLALDAAVKHGARAMNVYQLFSEDAAWDTSILNADGSAAPSYKAIWNWAHAHRYPTQPIVPVSLSRK